MSRKNRRRYHRPERRDGPFRSAIPQNEKDRPSVPILRAWESGLITRQEAVAELKSAGSAYGLWAHLQE